MALPNIPRGGGFGNRLGGGFGGMPLPERPRPVKPAPPKEEISKPVSPFTKRELIPPTEILRRAQTNPKLFSEISGGSPSTFKEVLDDINKEINKAYPGSSLTESKITDLQRRYKLIEQQAQQKGDSKGVHMAGKAWNLLERFKKGEF